MLAGGGVISLQPSDSFNLSGKGACCAAFRHGVVVGKVIARLKAGAAASAAMIIATDNNNSMRLNVLPPLARRVEGCTTGYVRLIGALRSGHSS